METAKQAATRLSSALDRPDWRPNRSHVEGARNALEGAAIELDHFRAFLTDANAMLRSTYQIAVRGGKETNWPAFVQMVGDMLDNQHKILFPTAEPPQ